MKTKIITLSFLGLFILNCGKPSPTFNPFDKLFDINIEMLHNDTTLRVVGDCMSYMHIKNHGEHETYYTVYSFSKKDSIAGKGLKIILEKGKTKIPMSSKFNPQDSLLIKIQNHIVDSIKNSPFDTIKVDSILNRYHLKRKNKITKFDLLSEKKEEFLIYENLSQEKFLFKVEFNHMWTSSPVLIGARKLTYNTYLSWEKINDSQFYK